MNELLDTEEREGTEYERRTINDGADRWQRHGEVVSLLMQKSIAGGFKWK
jgi:hypothetical protein